jgi:uncharacterized protein YeaC (DUF1315 family)|tara:strand:+ start:1187 stop:1318 length:132 start_codon:yes stop_codon:yes gene_type:complete
VILFWQKFKKALELQKWPVITNTEELLKEQKKKLDRLYGRIDK